VGSWSGVKGRLERGYNAAKDSFQEPPNKTIIHDFVYPSDSINGAYTYVLSEEDAMEFFSGKLEDEGEAREVYKLFNEIGGFMVDPVDRVGRVKIGGRDVTEDYKEKMSDPTLCLKTDSIGYQISVDDGDIEYMREMDEGRPTRKVTDKIGWATGLNRLRKTKNQPRVLAEKL
jgi:hypothetical protein